MNNKIIEKVWTAYQQVQEEAPSPTAGAVPAEKYTDKKPKGELDFIAQHGGLGGNDSGIDGAKAAAQTAASIAASAPKKAVPRPNDQTGGDTAMPKIKESKSFKSIRMEAMDPVGKEDGDVNNDGKKNKVDAYLANRRKKIGTAIKGVKEDTIVEKHGVFMSGGSVGEVGRANKPVKVFDNEADAKAHAAVRNKDRSPGEKKFYNVKYHVKPIKEAADDDREYGYEGDMAISQLKSIMRNAQDLMEMMDPETDLPEWLQSKITLAQDYVQTAADYMATEMDADEVDEAFERVDEVSNKKLDAYRQKAFADQPAGNDGSDKYRKRKAGRELAFNKQTGRGAKVRATNEEAEQIDELSKKTLGSYVKKASSNLADKSSQHGFNRVNHGHKQYAIGNLNHHLDRDTEDHLNKASAALSADHDKAQSKLSRSIRNRTRGISRAVTGLTMESYDDPVIKAAKRAAEEAHRKGLIHEPSGPSGNPAGKHISNAVKTALRGSNNPSFARQNDAIEIGVAHFKKLKSAAVKEEFEEIDEANLARIQKARLKAALIKVDPKNPVNVEKKKKQAEKEKSEWYNSFKNRTNEEIESS